MFSMPYTPEQNGVAERRNRTLLEMVRSMMALANLPTSFWGEALLTATYVLNRVPSKSVETTPYEVWSGKTPSLNHFKVWGCVGHVLNPDPKDKLKAKTRRCLFVGYSENSKGYRLYDPKEKVIIESRHVKFIEDRFDCDEDLGTNSHL